MKLSRRQLLSLAAARLLSGTEAPTLFEEIPPSASGITWVHDNAMSDERYLPETLNELQIEQFLEGIDTNALHGLRDRAMIDMLKSIGIEKGKKFDPDQNTQAVLKEAIGEARRRLEHGQFFAVDLDIMAHVDRERPAVIQKGFDRVRRLGIRRQVDDFSDRVLRRLVSLRPSGRRDHRTGEQRGDAPPS